MYRIVIQTQIPLQILQMKPCFNLYRKGKVMTKLMLEIIATEQQQEPQLYSRVRSKTTHFYYTYGLPGNNVHQSAIIYIST